MTDILPLPVQSDESLMDAVRSGNSDGLSELFERYHRPLYRFLVRYTGRPEVAEDIVQDVFLRVLKYRHTYRRGQAVRPWLYRIARNVWSDVFKQTDRQSEVALPDTMASGASAAEFVERQSEHDALLRALGALPADQREILLLARFEELSYQEIAALLNISVGNVKVRVHRAVRQLKALMIPNQSSTNE